MLLYELSNHVTDNLRYNDTLNPKLYDEYGNMHSEIHEALLNVAQNFVTDLDIPELNISDIVLTGSSANFNWNKFSDIDLHLITDIDIFADPHMAAKYFNAAKNVWNNNHDVTMRGLDTEVYVEDEREHNESLGRFSVMNNEWISKPTHKTPIFDEEAVNRKVRYLVREIDMLMDDNDVVTDIEHLKTSIWDMRKAGLAKGGEFSVENLAFKLLRNMGYLDKILRALDDAEDRELSIEGVNEAFDAVEANVEFSKPVAVKAVNMLNALYKKEGVDAHAFLVDKHTVDIDVSGGVFGGAVVDITDYVLDKLNGMYTNLDPIISTRVTQ